jgi:Cell division protein CrgA
MAKKTGTHKQAQGGRVTPKQNKRYTPPVPRSEKVSPIWIPIIMFGALGLGMLIILANYVDVLPGDGPSNMYLLAGLVLITVGFITATKFH